MNTLRCERTRRGTCAASPCLLLDRRAWNGVARHHRDGSLFWAPSSGKDTLYPASCRIVLYIEREREREGGIERSTTFFIFFIDRAYIYVCIYIYVWCAARVVLLRSTRLSASISLPLSGCSLILASSRCRRRASGIITPERFTEMKFF